MVRTVFVITLVVAFSGSAARAQFGYVGPGSTAQGDYLRGVGVAAFGLGFYNEHTAIADQINTQTFIMLNEYMWNVAKNENRENAEHRRRVLERAAEAYKQIQDRIRDNPEARDVMEGDALNKTLETLLSPQTSDSTARYAAVPLDVEWMRAIPFKLAEGKLVFSMNRLSLKGIESWAVAFKDDTFAPFRRDYQKAVDNALDLAMEQKSNQKAIEAIDRAIENLRQKLMTTPHVLDPKFQTEFSQAKVQLDKLSETVRLFEDQKILPVLAEIENYSGTTVDELRRFMRRHNLTFGKAETPNERDVYPKLLAALNEQRDKSK